MKNMKKSTIKNKFKNIILDFLDDVANLAQKNSKKVIDICADETTKKIDNIMVENKVILKNKIEEKSNNESNKNEEIKNENDK